MIHRRQPTAIGVILVALCALVGCRTRASGGSSKIPDHDMEAISAFVKLESCQPTTCGIVTCETFSDGQTGGLPSHIARCKWSDTRIASSATSTNQCAYVHYSANSEGDSFRNLFLSARAPSDTCVPDKEFADLIKVSQGYSGRVP